MRSWESPAYGTLTTKSALKLSQALREDGVIVSVDWLLNGIGPEPYHHKEIEQSTSLLEQLTAYRSINIHKELSAFISNSPHAIYTQIDDDSMAPQFNIGNFVCGYWLTGDDIKLLIGKPCIIENCSRELKCRLLAITASGFTTVSLSQPETLSDQYKFERVAPITKQIYTQKNFLKKQKE